MELNNSPIAKQIPVIEAMFNAHPMHGFQIEEISRFVDGVRSFVREHKVFQLPDQNFLYVQIDDRYEGNGIGAPYAFRNSDYGKGPVAQAVARLINEKIPHLKATVHNGISFSAPSPKDSLNTRKFYVLVSKRPSTT